MEKMSLLLMGWRRNAACLGGGLLLLLISRRFVRRQSPTSQSPTLQSSTSPLSLPSCGRWKWSLLLMGWRRNTAFLGGALLLFLVSRRFARRQSPTSLLSFLKPSFGGRMIWPFSCLMKKSSSSSGRAVEADRNIDGPQPPDEGALEWTNSHEGLETGELIMMPGDLEPNIISMADPTSGRCFSMKSGLPKNAFPRSRADCNLMEWLRDREDNGITPLATLDVPGLRSPTYVRDEIRQLIKSLIQFIQYLHGQGCCISGGRGTFRPVNIHVVGQNLKFNVLELSSFTEELQDQDYKSICRIITTTIFKKKTKLLPYDMQHLLKLLMNPRPHVYLISKHVALMNSIACRDFILLLWDKRKTLNPAVYKKWQNSIKGLSVGKYCGADNRVGKYRWADNIHQDSPLLKVYQGAKYQYHKTSTFHLIRFFRNAAAHLSDHSCRGKRFQFEHISLIITDSFPNVLADLQERLNDYGILQEFV